MNATTHLEETCSTCVEGVVPDRVNLWRTCPDCNGTGRRIRSTHAAASAIDYDPEAEARIERLLAEQRAAAPRFDLPTPERWARIRELAAVCRDETNSEPVRMLLEEVGR